MNGSPSSAPFLRPRPAGATKWGRTASKYRGDGNMRKYLSWIYIAAGAACAAYYFVLGHASRFGLSMSWMWLALGAAFIGAGVLSRARLPRWLRCGWRALLCAGLIAVLALEIPVISGMRARAPANLDALIVLGARVDPDGPSPALRRRLNATMAVLDEHPNAVVIASGGKGADEPVSEAQCIRDELVRRGVDASRIIMEDRSTNTAENLAFSAALLEDRCARVGVITNNYHVWRSVRIARRARLENACGIAAAYTGPTLFHYMIREALCIAVDALRGNL